MVLDKCEEFSFFFFFLTVCHFKWCANGVEEKENRPSHLCVCNKVQFTDGVDEIVQLQLLWFLLCLYALALLQKIT